MERTGRYDTSGFAEGQFEPGSRRRVLRNLIAINRKRAMNAIESTELLRTTEKLIRVYDGSYRFNAKDLCTMHKEWLGRIYEWAGNYRSVNLAKDGFPFREGNGRVARLLASLMALQAGSPLLDFGMPKGRRKQEYFRAIQCGLDRRYGPMEKIFGEVIERTLRLRRR
jgi:cell filamentation protein